MRKLLIIAAMIGALGVSGLPKAPTSAAVDLAGGPNRPTCLGKFAPC